MITIPIQEGEAFDRLSILAVKGEKIYNDQNINNLIDYFMLLRETIPNLNAIIASEEYRNLKEINALIFDVIELIRNSARVEICSAAKLDELNTIRAIRKNMLHRKFFGSEIMEFKTKIGL